MERKKKASFMLLAYLAKCEWMILSSICKDLWMREKCFSIQRIMDHVDDDSDVHHYLRDLKIFVKATQKNVLMRRILRLFVHFLLLKSHWEENANNFKICSSIVLENSSYSILISSLKFVAFRVNTKTFSVTNLKLFICNLERSICECFWFFISSLKKMF